VVAPTSSLSCDECTARVGSDLFDQVARDRCELFCWERAQNLRRHIAAALAAPVDATPPDD
jgi:hypothetical protein